MIVSGTTPPYQLAPRDSTEFGFDFIKLPKRRSDVVFDKKPKENTLARSRLRPKSSVLQISEKILKDFNIEDPRSQLLLPGDKYKKNLRMVEGKFSAKGLHFKTVQPGYSMTKRKDGINVTLNMDELCAGANKEQLKFSSRDERSTTLKTLQQQLDNLNNMLEEERLVHHAQFKQFIENTKVDVQVMLQEHRDHIRSIEEEHREEIDRLTDMYGKKLMERKAKAESEAARLQEEIYSVKQSLESCKEDVVVELTEKWLVEKRQLECDNEIRTKQALEQQRHKLKQDRFVEVNELKQNHEQDIIKLVGQHQNEMDLISDKFLACAADAEKLQVALLETEKLKQEVNDLQGALSDTKKQLKKTKNELADAKVTLLGYELSFSEKVAEIEERHSMKIHGLMLNNTDIKRNYMRKCTELLDVQTKTDIAQKKSTTVAKTKMKTIILARAKAHISLVASNENKEAKPTTPKPSRPQSAPNIKLQDTQTTLYRPNSSLT